MNVIKNRLGQYWQAGEWVDHPSDAIQFERSERAVVKLGTGETWQTIQNVTERLDYLRGEIENERIIYGEIAELESLAKHIPQGDVLLLQWANVEESE